MKAIHLTAALAICSASLHAANLNVSVRSGGSAAVNVAPGEIVNYEVSVVLSDSNNEGLGAVLFDLSFSGGALSQANEPSSNPMMNFDRPAGMTNPAGFGGTVISGNLIQVGGAQNTIKNTMINAPFPIGTVIPDVGQSSVVVVTGSLVAPMTEGPYTLSASNVVASAIVLGEDGSGSHWATEPVGQGTVSNLTITVAGVPVLSGQGAGARYLAITPPDGASPIALLVKGSAGDSDVSCVSAYVQTNGTLAATALFQTPAQWGTTVYVGDSEIMPSTVYTAQVDSGSPGSPVLSSPVMMTTWKWGDANNSGAVNLDDILCELSGFSGSYTSCSLQGDDMQGEVPNGLINLDDILAVLNAFGSGPYPHAAPCP